MKNKPMAVFYIFAFFIVPIIYLAIHQQYLYAGIGIGGLSVLFILIKRKDLVEKLF